MKATGGFLTDFSEVSGAQLGIRAIICPLMIAFGCAHPQPAGLVNAPVGASDTPAAATPQSSLRRFELAAPKDSEARKELLDVFHMLRAEELQRRGDLENSTKAWLSAAKIGWGSFGDRAFRGWVRSLCATIEKPVSPDLLAKLIASESSDGISVPHMRKEGISSPEQYLDAVRKISPSCLTSSDADSPETAPLVTDRGVPPDDRFLSRRAAQFCKYKKARPIEGAFNPWASWLVTLSEAEKRFWIGKTSECMDDPEGAIHAYLAAAPQLLNENKNAALGLECHQRVVQIYRGQGQREAAARAYLLLMSAWQSPNVTPSSLALPGKEFRLKHIDDLLWASRYSAMILDYESAKRFAQESMTEGTAALRETRNLSSADREKFANFKAEAYHVLAFRVAVENQDFDAAHSLSLVALQTRDISIEWKERLTWYLGLYEFTMGRFDDARRRWETLLGETQDLNQRPKLYYWLARAHKSLEQLAESEFYARALIDDHPLSFYAVVATELTRLNVTNSWRDTFKPDRDLQREFITFDDMELDPLRRKAGRLLLRAETLTQAGLSEYARMAIKELDPVINEGEPSQKTLRQRLYAIRLNHAAGNYSRAVKLTSDLANEQEKFWQKNTEHIFAFFPQPYSDLFNSLGSFSGIDPAIALGVCRQESTFDPAVKSPAQAIGLMQLLTMTAKKHNPTPDNLGLQEIAAKLTDPAFNIQSGVNYLKSLYKYYRGNDPAVFAAYNAGEYVVDGWLQHRANPDPVMWVELIPFGETQGYVKNVWRNVVVYRYLRERYGSQTSAAGTDGSMGRSPPTVSSDAEL